MAASNSLLFDRFFNYYPVSSSSSLSSSEEPSASSFLENKNWIIFFDNLTVCTNEIRAFLQKDEKNDSLNLQKIVETCHEEISQKLKPQSAFLEESIQKVDPKSKLSSHFLKNIFEQTSAASSKPHLEKDSLLIARYSEVSIKIYIHDIGYKNSYDQIDEQFKELCEVSYIKHFLAGGFLRQDLKVPLTPIDLLSFCYNFESFSKEKSEFEISISKSARSIIDKLKNLSPRDKEELKYCEWLFVIDEIFKIFDTLKNELEEPIKNLVQFHLKKESSEFENDDFKIHLDKLRKVSQHIIRLTIFLNILENFYSDIDISQIQTFKLKLLNILKFLLHIMTNNETSLSSTTIFDKLNFSYSSYGSVYSDFDTNWSEIVTNIKKDPKKSIKSIQDLLEKIKKEKIEEAKVFDFLSKKSLEQKEGSTDDDDSPSPLRKIRKNAKMIKSSPTLPSPEELKKDSSFSSKEPTKIFKMRSTIDLPKMEEKDAISKAIIRIVSNSTLPALPSEAFSLSAKSLFSEKELDETKSNASEAFSLSAKFSFQSDHMKLFNTTLDPTMLEVWLAGKMLKYLNKHFEEDKSKSIFDILNDAFPKNKDREARIRKKTADSIIYTLTTYPVSTPEEKKLSKEIFLINQAYHNLTEALITLYSKFVPSFNKKEQKFNDESVTLQLLIFDDIFALIIGHITYLSVYSVYSTFSLKEQKQIEEYKQKTIFVLSKLIICVANKMKKLDVRAPE